MPEKWGAASPSLTDPKEREPFLTFSFLLKFNWLPVKSLNENKITAKDPEIWNKFLSYVPAEPLLPLGYTSPPGPIWET